MTWNIHHGVGSDGLLDLERIARVIDQEEIDLVALQEVDRGVARTGQRDLAAELASLTGMEFAFSNNYHFGGGEYGNAILSRYPVLQWTNTHYEMLGSAEQRGVLQALIDLHGTEVVFVSTHLDAQRPSLERAHEVAQLPLILSVWKEWPVILCGDFNATPQDPVLRELTENPRWIDAWTMAKVKSELEFTSPAQNPRRRIDYIWITKDYCQSPADVLECTAKTLPTVASDHLPVVVTMNCVGANEHLEPHQE